MASTLLDGVCAICLLQQQTKGCCYEPLMGNFSLEVVVAATTRVLQDLTSWVNILTLFFTFHPKCMRIICFKINTTKSEHFEKLKLPKRTFFFSFSFYFFKWLNCFQLQSKKIPFLRTILFDSYLIVACRKYLALSREMRQASTTFKINGGG